MNTPYTCITCRVAFRDLDIQRQHYKSDWHRYNLKRKVAELPPVTSDEFQRRVIAQRGKEEQSYNCKACRKSFNTKNQYENHLTSKKHKEKALSFHDEDILETTTLEAAKNAENLSKKNNSRLHSRFKNPPETLEDMEIDSEIESIDSDEWIEDTENPVENNDCIFCSHHSRSFVRNLKHMTEAHSFFLPDPEYCTNPRGLLIYLGEKVYAGYMCLWCNNSGKAFQSADAARTHMLDKGHCKMLHEGEALIEYADFYDYSSSYPDEGYDNPDEEVEISEIDDSDYQLVLPSGATIGHRSLMRYYKQSLDPNRALALPKRDKLRAVLTQYRALGWTDTQKEAVIKKARDIKYMQKVQARYSTQLQFKANKLQKHFRQQVNF
ncbi:zinc finger protein 622 [Neodiprion fabricii]|uniref:zinc finger protein 622 n=1 Tax=Neodiprion fabricii TaxID=2872261 RepID=UPI001ED932EF|nr:zinc finger protein 622 [Neodiprion fabricii]XP_046421083.1 zinc finger protein 622 [Neodiprion fabricii]XP_046421084.1 zinc finger protein 622 [Neodiprion fabricii]XP_046421085.1 zinc finger protein 622 [Neodiprion fabricii]